MEPLPFFCRGVQTLEKLATSLALSVGKDVFARSDFEALAKQLKNIKSHFILSINDVLEIRKQFKWASIEAVETTYTVGKSNGKKAEELIISNE